MYFVLTEGREEQGSGSPGGDFSSGGSSLWSRRAAKTFLAGWTIFVLLGLCGHSLYCEPALVLCGFFVATCGLGHLFCCDLCGLTVVIRVNWELEVVFVAFSIHFEPRFSSIAVADVFLGLLILWCGVSAPGFPQEEVTTVCCMTFLSQFAFWFLVEANVGDHIFMVLHWKMLATCCRRFLVWWSSKLSL